MLTSWVTRLSCGASSLRSFAFRSNAFRNPATVRALVLSLRDITAVLKDADPKLKAEVYAELGVEVTYNPERRMVLVNAGPTRVQQNVSERRLLP